MEGLYKLKDMLCEELDEYGKKGELSAGALEIVDKLSHALKSISTVIAMEENGYSETYPAYQDSSYNRRSSYRGSYARRDSRGRYSREDGYSGAMEDMVEQLEEMKQTAPDTETKKELQRLIQKFRRG